MRYVLVKDVKTIGNADGGVGVEPMIKRKNGKLRQQLTQFSRRHKAVRVFGEHLNLFSSSLIGPNRIQLDKGERLVRFDDNVYKYRIHGDEIKFLNKFIKDSIPNQITAII